MNYWTEELPFFSKAELCSRDSGIIKLDIRFAVHFPMLRLAWGDPLYPTSICRTPSHNADVGGHPRSLHLTKNPVHPTNGTMAADIRWHDWTPQRRNSFACFAWCMGWSVGLHPIFCHVDRRADIGLQQTVFLYDTWDNQFSRDDVMSGSIA